jgi:hypothetical protein
MCFYDEKNKTLQDPWNVSDVQSVRSDLNEDQACDVLDHVADNFDANIGINWDVIWFSASVLFPEPLEDATDA